MALKDTKIGEIEKAARHALEYLRGAQMSSGEFKSYRSTDPAMIKDCEFDSSPFPTALISYCLSFSDASEAEEMLRKATAFFLAEMEPGGVWRYWTAAHPFHKHIPPDLDDIACVSLILKMRGVEFPDNRKLVFANCRGDGLFYTWIVPRFSAPTLAAAYWLTVLRVALRPLSLYYFWKLNESAPGDVDCVVNANALLYLGESEATAPVVEYLIRIIEREKEDCCDKWHLNRFTFYYTISRNYFAGMSAFASVRDVIIKRILRVVKEDGMIGENALDTALAVCALINLRVENSTLEKSIDFLLMQQIETGEWVRIPLYYGGPKKYFGWGSEEITTAFCLEALTRYQQKAGKK